MQCPICKHDEDKVIFSGQRGADVVRRRRECLHCGHRFNTFESTEDTAMKLAELKQKLAPLAEYIEPQH